jgi:Tfp pilus assembly protein PilE
MRAFTLIETLLYLGIFSIVLVGMLESFSTLQESIGRAQTRAQISQEGNFLEEKITFAIRNNVSPYSFTTAQGALFIQDASGTQQLSDNSERISNLNFSSTSGAIFSSFMISATSSNGQSLSRTFEDTSYIFP